MLVDRWLAEQLEAIALVDPLQVLIDRLLTADSWLAQVSPDRGRLTFTIGAIVEEKPIYILVTNQEDLSRHDRTSAALRKRLSVFEMRPTTARTFISGQKATVYREIRWRLRCAAQHDDNIERVFDTLVKENLSAARRNPMVSPRCRMSFISFAGDLSKVREALP